jgi:hypothetical protein
MAKPFYFVPFQWVKITKMLSLMTVLYVAMKNFSIVGTGIETYIDSYIAPLVTTTAQLLGIDTLWQGKLLKFSIDKLPTIVDSALIFLYSLLYLPGLVIVGVFPFAKIGLVAGLKRSKG